jgi:chemotaxis response regulator CheB
MNNDERTKMRVQPPEERIHNFKEVEQGFTKEEVKATLIGGLAGGLSALKTILVELKEG